MSLALPIVQLGGSSSGGCASGACGSGACGSSVSSEVREDIPIQTSVPFAARRLNLNAVPTTGTPVTVIDLDLTVECNLRCTYCFKEKWNEHMEERVAFDAVVWLLYASGPVRSVHVNFMGGEPLIRFKLIKKLVPFGTRRAAQMGKTIHFGMTTNGTLVTDEVVLFFKKWGIGFHTSIDGTPEVQDRNRPTTGGRGSSHLVEKAVPKILACRPGTTARSTIVPDAAGTLVESYHYFRSLGYIDIAFVPGGPSFWDHESIGVFQDQFMQVAQLVVDEYRRGARIRMKGIDDAMEGIVRGQRRKHACGAGRGLLLVDIHGDIWPCHRWNREKQSSWRIGSIFEQFNEDARRILDQPDQSVLLEQDCPRCIANNFCVGGCPAENLEETGTVYRRHNNSCELTRVWSRAGRLVHDTLYAERNEPFMRAFYGASEPSPVADSATA